MDDFIFGTLATDELRLAQTQKRWAGVTHAHRRVPLDPRPGEAVSLTLSVGPSIPVQSAWVYWTTDGSEPGGSHGRAARGYATPLQPMQTEWQTLMWGYLRYYAGYLPGQPAGTVLRYRMSVVTLDGAELWADDGGCFGIYVDEDPLPEWARDAIVYHIFVDRFYPGAGRAWGTPPDPGGFYGGTLRGILEKLDYLTALGVNALYLSPIFASPSHHGYDVTDLFSIEPRLGTLEDFRALLDAAHAAGLRVILDFVPNHLSNQHPIFVSASSDPNSPYRDWFTFTHWPDEYATFFGVKELPQLNLLHPQARAHMLEAARYWLEFGVDGYRLDYAIGPTADFWADFRRVTRAARPDCWTFGEIVDPPDAQLAFSGGLDGSLDFLLLEALRQTFAFGRWDALRFASFLERHEAFFPEDFSRPAFLDNHDMNRFLWACGGDKRRLKLAALCQFTLSGPPLIYYGTEVGLSQERDVRQGNLGFPHEARLPMLWDDAQDAELLGFYRELIALRRASFALRRGQRRMVQVTPETLAYTRSGAGETLVTVLNLADEPRTVNLPASAALRLTTDAGCAVSPSAPGTRVTLPPLTGAILTL